MNDEKNFFLYGNLKWMLISKRHLNCASLGNVFGISCNLGCYENGIGTSINKQRAFELYQQAANLENSDQNNYVYCFWYCTLYYLHIIMH